MSIFPASPTNGLIVTDTDGTQYQFSAASNSWVLYAQAAQATANKAITNAAAAQSTASQAASDLAAEVTRAKAAEAAAATSASNAQSTANAAIVQATFQVSAASPPATPFAGQEWRDTADGSVYKLNTVSWIQFA